MVQLNKRGISTKWLITMILLVMGFVIILLVYSQFAWKDTITKETCHNSVVLKASVPELPGAIKPIDMPLRCQTEKICITTNALLKGDCEEFAGETYVTKRVSSDPQQQIKEIQQIIAESMVDCWSMMGEGKLKGIFAREGKEVFPSVGNLATAVVNKLGYLIGITSYDTGTARIQYFRKCVICSRVAFAKDIKQFYGSNTRIPGVISYLNKAKPAGKEYTFLQFLTNNRNIRFSEARVANTDFLYVNREYAMVFSEYHTDATPERLFGAIGGLIGATTLGKFFGAGGVMVGGAGGYYFGTKAGLAAMAFVGANDSYITSWSFMPVRPENPSNYNFFSDVHISTSTTDPCYGTLNINLIPSELKSKFSQQIPIYWRTKENGGFEGTNSLKPWGEVPATEIKSVGDITSSKISSATSQDVTNLGTFLNNAQIELASYCYTLQDIQCHSFEGLP